MMDPARPIFIRLGLVFCLVFTAAPLFSAECIPGGKTASYLPEGLDQPSDLALGPNGDIFIVDGVNNRIVVLSPDGRIKFSFGGGGTAPGTFSHPMGIDIATDGQVFIADTGNHRIQVFNAKGDFVRLFPVHTSAAERPAAPVDVLVPGVKNLVFISDRDNHKIRVHQQSGAFAFEWGRFGDGQGEFRYPGILAKTEYNEILVVDVLNTRVQKFTPSGRYISEIGSWGVTPGALFRPKGVCVDENERVYISDSYLGCIQVFTDLGTFLGIVCDGDSPKKFVTPVGLAIDRQNRLYTVEMRANRLTVLHLAP